MAEATKPKTPPKFLSLTEYQTLSPKPYRLDAHTAPGKLRFHIGVFADSSKPPVAVCDAPKLAAEQRAVIAKTLAAASG